MASQKFTPAERIRELSTINADVAAMVDAAGKAVTLLANGNLSSIANGVQAADGEDAHMTEDEAKDSLEARKAAFTAHTTQYYDALQGVIARLRRQAYALEEAGILLDKAPTLSAAGQQRDSPAQASGRSQAGGQSQSATEVDRITNGGLGNFDVGWLNSRGNKVGAEKEAELILEAKKLVKQALDADSTNESNP